MYTYWWDKVVCWWFRITSVAWGRMTWCKLTTKSQRHFRPVITFPFTLGPLTVWAYVPRLLVTTRKVNPVLRRDVSNGARLSRVRETGESGSQRQWGVRIAAIYCTPPLGRMIAFLLPIRLNKRQRWSDRDGWVEGWGGGGGGWCKRERKLLGKSFVDFFISRFPDHDD